MAESNGQPKQVQGHFVTNQELERDIEIADVRGMGGGVIALASGAAIFFSLRSKDPEAAAVFVESVGGVGGLGLSAESIMHGMMLRRRRERQGFGVPAYAFEEATKKQPIRTKVDRVRSSLRRLWAKQETAPRKPIITEPPVAEQPRSTASSLPNTDSTTPNSTAKATSEPAQTYPVEEGKRQSVAEQQQQRRRGASYLHSLFGVAKHAAPNHIAELQRIADLAEARDPTAFPDGVYQEAEDTWRFVTDNMLKEDGQRTKILFSTASPVDYPHGLSVAVALSKLGFGNDAARRQFKRNITDASRNGVIQTRARIKGETNRLTVKYSFDGTDTQVVIEAKHYKTKKSVEASKEVQPKAKPMHPPVDRSQRTTMDGPIGTRGNELDHSGDGASHGRKRSPHPHH